MNVKEMVELNNQRRKLLTKENLKYYEDTARLYPIVL